MVIIVATVIIIIIGIACIIIIVHILIMKPHINSANEANKKSLHITYLVRRKYYKKLFNSFTFMSYYFA